MTQHTPKPTHTPTLDRLADLAFPGTPDGRARVVALLDALDTDTLRAARIERVAVGRA